MLRNSIDVGCTPNVLEFLSEMGFKQEYEYMCKGCMFRKGRMKILVYKIYKVSVEGSDIFAALLVQRRRRKGLIAVFNILCWVMVRAGSLLSGVVTLMTLVVLWYRCTCSERLRGGQKRQLIPVVESISVTMIGSLSFVVL